MGPSPSGEVSRTSPSSPPSRKSSSSADHSAANTGPGNNAPTSFVLRSESELAASGLPSTREITEGKSIDDARAERGRDSSFWVQSDASTGSASTRMQDSNFGVKSLSCTLAEAFGRDESEDKGEGAAMIDEAEGKKAKDEDHMSQRTRIKRRRRSGSPTSSPSRPHTDASLPPPRLRLPATSPSRSVSVTSLRLSEGDSCLSESMSAALASSAGSDAEGEEYPEREDDEGEQTCIEESDSFPQLVMPSIQMPTRRPFTDKGRAMGKLKVLIAGAAGVGKTSLIKCIVQHCEDIVHVDPLSPSQSLATITGRPSSSRRKSSAQKSEVNRGPGISEIHASTKAYPHWWSDLEESRVKRRKSSSSDSVLERNITFIDTAGYSTGTSARRTQDAVVEYVERLLCKHVVVGEMEDSEVVGVMAGSGGVQVDVVFYLLNPAHDISADVEYMQRLSALTNVIPIIAKADTISASEVVAVKTSVLARLLNTSMKPFFFGKSVEDALLAVQGLPIVAAASQADSNNTLEGTEYPFNMPTYPYAISTHAGQDLETMDASLLMSPDYVQPLLSSELPTLISQVFDPESTAWLRHSAARKFLAWRRRNDLSLDSPVLRSLAASQGTVPPLAATLPHDLLAPRTASIHSPLSPSASASASASVFRTGILIPRPDSSFYLSTLSHSANLSPSPSHLELLSLSHSHTYTDTPGSPLLSHDWDLARYATSAQGEHRFSDFRLAKWAADLQRSRRNERDMFEALQRQQRENSGAGGRLWTLDTTGIDGDAAQRDAHSPPRSHRRRHTHEGEHHAAAEGRISMSPGGTPRASWAITKRDRESRYAHPSDPHYQPHHHDPYLPGSSKWGSRAVDKRDPLGLLGLGDELKTVGVRVVGILGGVGVVGTLVVAVLRATGVDVEEFWRGGGDGWWHWGRE